MAERKVSEHKVVLPDVYRGFLLINALSLSDSEIKTLLTFTHGSIQPKDINHWLRKHETKLQASQLGLEGQDRKTKASATATPAVNLVEGELDDLDEDLEPRDGDIAEMEALLTDLQSGNGGADEIGVFDEDEAAEILAAMIKEKRKSYTQSAQLKKDKELGRGFRQGAPPRDGPL